MMEHKSSGWRSISGQLRGSENDAGDLIASALRAHFDDVAKAPVPDKFMLLLAELEAKEQAAAKAPNVIGEANLGDPI
jgi:Anti-sigma factor NepR